MAQKWIGKDNVHPKEGNPDKYINNNGYDAILFNGLTLSIGFLRFSRNLTVLSQKINYVMTRMEIEFLEKVLSKIKKLIAAVVQNDGRWNKVLN